MSVRKISFLSSEINKRTIEHFCGITFIANTTQAVIRSQRRLYVREKEIRDIHDIHTKATRCINRKGEYDFINTGIHTCLC